MSDSNSKLPIVDILADMSCAPQDQEAAPNLSAPESRGDLEALSRLAIEQFSAAFGEGARHNYTPRSSLTCCASHCHRRSERPHLLRWIFWQVHFTVSNSIEPLAPSTYSRPMHSFCRLSLLNVTVAQLAKSVNSVLTIAYRDVYASGPDDDLGQLQLLTSPLAATEEVVNLFASGLAPLEIAMPACLHAIGTTKEDIVAAVEKAVAERDKQEQKQTDEDSYNTKGRELSIEERVAALEGKKKENALIGKDTGSASSSVGVYGSGS